MMNKIFAFIILLCVIIFFSGQASPDSSIIDNIIDKSHEYSLNITSYRKGQSGKAIVFIEDAHCNYQAQKQLSEIISCLNTIGCFNFIAVEGSSGEILTQFLSSFPNTKIRFNIAENLLKNSFISGEEYFSIIKSIPVRIRGVDDEVLYKKNLSFFRKAYDLSPRANVVIDETLKSIDKLKQKNYSGALMDFDTAYASFMEGAIGIDQLIEICRKRITSFSLIINKYPNILKANNLAIDQRNFDYGKLETQVNSVCGFMLKNTKKDIPAVKKLMADHLTGKISGSVFYRGIAELAKKNMPDNQDKYSLIIKYSEINQAASEIFSADLIAGISKFATECYGSLIKTENERDVFELDVYIKPIIKLSSLKMTKNEYSVFIEKYTDKLNGAANIDKIMDALKLQPDNAELIKLIISNNIGFYQSALSRDIAIIKNTLSVMDNDKIQTAILIAGGFHRDKIIESCIEQGISYAVITPKASIDSKTDNYAPVLLRDNIAAGFASNTYLRASSFFAERSFDEVKMIAEFRNKLIFGAVMEHLSDTGFSYIEVYDLIKSWRSAFIKSLSSMYPEGSLRHENARNIFDHLVTDVFSPGNFMIDKENKSITVANMGRLLKLSVVKGKNINIEDISSRNTISNDDLNAFDLLSNPIKLTTSNVFISAWTITDNLSAYVGHGDAHYSVKYIQALNKRGISPVVILPEDSLAFQKTLVKYESALAGLKLDFKFAVYSANEGKYHELDIKGNKIGELTVGQNIKPIVIQLSSNIDLNSDSRLDELNSRFAPLLKNGIQPLFLRIPTAGSSLTALSKINTLDLYFNPISVNDNLSGSIESGFAVDLELLDLIKSIKVSGVTSLRNSALERINSLSKGVLKRITDSIDGFGFDQIAKSHWSFRYLTEKSDSELASFMKAVELSKEKKVIFTFYNSKFSVDLKHKAFLKQRFKFIDLQEVGNNNLIADSDTLIINLPPLDSGFFKLIMGISDSAVVSGENSLIESLILNKFDIGPAVLFKPAIKDHMSILSNSLSGKDRGYLLNKLNSYAGISDLPEENYLDNWRFDGNLNDLERFIHDVFFEPQSNILLRSSLSEIGLNENGLNTLAGIIKEIDEDLSISRIIENHRHQTKNEARKLLNEFMLNPSSDFISKTGQTVFIESKLREFTIEFAMKKAQTRVDAETIKTELADLFKMLPVMYADKLKSMDVIDYEELSDNFRHELAIFYYSINVAGDGHLFLPENFEGRIMYAHYYIDWQSKPDAKRKGGSFYQKEFLAKDTMENLSKYSDDLNQARLLLDYSEKNISKINLRFAEAVKILPFVKDLFDFFRMNGFPNESVGRNQKKEILKDYVSNIMMFQMRQAQPKYADKLQIYYGDSNIKTFSRYIIDSLTGIVPIDNELMADYREIVASSLNTISILHSDNGLKLTNFFRQHNNWMPQLEDYLNDIIIQKIASEDFLINVRSIGSSTGKEAYTIGGIIENALLSYANKVYANITDKKKKDALVNKWVDSWNINIYAFDSDYARLAISKEGFYLLDVVDTAFFETTPEYKRIFKDYTAIDVKHYFARVSPRIRNWLRPVYINLNEDISTVAGTQADVTFMMNVLPYLKSDETRQLIIETVLKPSKYKSFVSYNDSFAEPPINFGVIEGQPLIVPPAGLPDFQTVDNLVQMIGAYNEDVLLKILGISKSELSLIYNTKIKFEAKILIERLFDNDKYFSLLGKDNTIITADLLKPYFSKSVMRFMNDNRDKVTINTALTLFYEHLISEYRSYLLKNSFTAPNAENLTNIFAKELSSFLDSIQVLSDGSLITPFELDGRSLYEHTYFTNTAFVPPDGIATTPLIQSNIIDSESKKRLVKDVNDIKYAREIIGLFLTESVFAGSNSDLLPPTYIGSKQQIETMFNHIAESLLYSLRLIAAKNASTLIERFGKADLESLLKYLTGKGGALTKDDTIQSDFSEIKDALSGTIKKSIGSTSFFRDSSGWYKSFEAYLNDLISQKVAKGDFSLSLRNLGAGIGKEVYSVASVVDVVLSEYAMEHVYKNISDPFERKRLSDLWVDSWNIKVYAFDFSLQRTASCKEGLYLLDDGFYNFIDSPYGYGYENMASAKYKGDGYHPIARMKSRLIRWVIPVYCDLNKDISPVINNPAEITFALNTIPYLKVSAQSVHDAIIGSANPRYKGYYAFNDKFNEPPINLSLVPGQPQVIPQKNLPELADIFNVAGVLGKTSIADLAKVFGVTEDIIAENFDPALYEASIRRTDSFFSGKIAPRDKANQSLFLNNILIPYLKNYAMDLIKDKIEEEVILDNIYKLKTYFVSAYSRNLHNSSEKNINRAIESFSGKIDELISGISVLDGHLFVPFTKEGALFYDHSYYSYNDYGEFIKDTSGKIIEAYYNEINWDIPAAESMEPVVVSEILTSKDSLLKYIEGKKYAKAIIKLLLKTDRVFLFQSSDLIPSSYLSAYKKSIITGDFDLNKVKVTPSGNINLYDNYMELLSESMMSYLYFIIDINRGVLETDDLNGLYQYLKNTGDIPYVMAKELYSLRDALLSNKQNEVITEMFRSSHNWLKNFEDYLSGLIIQKVLSGDFTISVRSAGGSIGKEAYSIGASIEKMLVKYAKKHFVKGIKDENERSRIINEWLNKWDIKIYVFDINPGRLAIAKEARYLLGPAEIEFFQKNPGYKTMFSEITFLGDRSSSFSEKQKQQYDHYMKAWAPLIKEKLPEPDLSKEPVFYEAAYAVVKDRLKNWIIPIFANFNQDLAILRDHPSEITFFMNILPYLSTDIQRRAAIDVLLESSNPSYKSYFAYNNKFNMPPESHGALKEQPQTLPSEKKPDIDTLYSIVLGEQIESPLDIAGILGLPVDEVEDKYGFLTYHDAAKLIYKYSRKEGVDFNSITGQQVFIDNVLNNFVKGFIVGLMKQHTDSVIIKNRLSAFSKQLSMLYKYRLFKANNPEAGILYTEFDKKLNLFFGSIQIPADNHFFMPLYSEDKKTFLYTYVDWQPFSTVDILRNFPVEYSRKLDSDSMATIIKTLSDTQHVKDIFNIPGYIDFKDLFDQWHAYENWDYRLTGQSPFYTGAIEQIETLKEHVASLSIGYFNELVPKYQDELIRIYGIANLKTLSDFIKENFKGLKPNDELAKDLRRVAELIAPFDAMGATYFFRESKYWLEPFKEYLNDLIRLKIANGNYSISISSIGASYGKEAYSIAAVLEESLMEYASKNLYSGEPKDKIEYLSRKWIENWNISIYAFEKDMQKLVAMKEGVFILSKEKLDDDEVAFFDAHPQYQSMFSEFKKIEPAIKNGVQFPRYIVRVNPMLTGWIKPVQTDLMSDKALSIIKNTRSEIIFTLNTLPYLISNKRDLKDPLADPNAVAKRMIDTIIASQSSGYKTFLVHNIKFNTPPVSFGFLEGQPYTLPPNSSNDIKIVYNLVRQLNIKNLDDIIKISGINNPLHPVLKAFFELEPKLSKLFDDAIQGIKKPGISDLKWIQSFVDNSLSKYISGYIADSIKNGVNPVEIRFNLSYILDLLMLEYKNRLASLGLSQTGKAELNFAMVAGTFLSAIQDTENNHWFIPKSFDLNLYDHLYIRRNIFSIGKPESKGGITLDVMPASRVTEAIKQENDIEYAKMLIQPMYFYNTVGDGILSGVILNDNQLAALHEHLAVTAIPYLYELIHQNAEFLFKKYGVADMRTLSDYILFRGESDKERKLIDGVNNIIASMKTNYYSGKSIASFTRLSELVEPFGSFIDTLILQKTASNDFSITVRVIGVQSGKETYIAARLIEDSLKRHALRYLYKDIKQDREKNILIQNWIDLWDIRVHSYSSNYDTLISLKEGVFKLDDAEKNYYKGNAVFKNTFEGIGNGLWAASDRLRKWVVPAYWDFNYGLPLNIKAEITFSPNISQFDVKEDSVKKIVRETSNPLYKSLLFYGFNSDKINGQHITFQPLSLPSVDTINALSRLYGIYNINLLAKILGISSSQIDDFLIGLNFDNRKTPISNLNNRYKSMDFSDSMV